MKEGKGKGKGKEKEEVDDEGRSEERKAESVTGSIGDWAKDLEKALNSAKYNEQESSSAFTEAEPITMSQDQIDMAYQLCRERIPIDSIMQMMGVQEGAVYPLELKRVVLEAELTIVRDLSAQSEYAFKSSKQRLGLTSREDETHGQAQHESGEEEFEAYDPVKWETATEENTIFSESLEAPPGTPTSEGSHVLKDLEKDSQQEPQFRLAPAQDFVRALRDPKVGSKPYFRKGDILRVINRGSRGDLDDRFFELLPLKPPGEAGPALIQDFEPADQEAVDEVGKEARTAKEVDSFSYALSWED